MNKLDIRKGSELYTICIENRKFLIGNNYLMKYNIFKNIREYFTNSNESEYSIDHNQKTSILLNEKALSKKHSFFYHITPNFSLNNDLKLAAKSLLNRYFDLLYNNNQYSDTLHTINILMESLAEEISSDSIIHVDFTPIVAKQLLKLTNPYIIDEQLNKNEFDLTYEEIIVYQLQLVKYIIKHDKTLSSIVVLVDLPYINSKLLNEINTIEEGFILIQTPYYHNAIPMNEIVVCEDILLDFQNEEHIYNILTSYEYNFKSLLMEDIKNMLEKYAYKQTREQCRLIDHLLE